MGVACGAKPVRIRVVRILLDREEQLRHRLTKAVGGLDRDSIHLVLSRADALCAAIPPDRFDFDRAKAEVMRATKL